MDKTARILEQAEVVAKLVEEAILTEALLTPKPGLVDAKDSGAHKDMDIFTFVRSAISLRSGFVEMYSMGADLVISPGELLTMIRPLGIAMEKDMFKATEGVNTHKGIIFSMGLLVTALGRFFSQKGEIFQGSLPKMAPQETEEVFFLIKKITEGLVSKDFENLEGKEQLTHGEKLYVRYGFKGIRGEAEAGYPVLREIILPYLRTGQKNLSYEERLLEVLMLLMTSVEDSNIVTRGGMEALAYTQKVSASFLEDGGMGQEEAYKKLQEMNTCFIKRNLSPGGAADLLSLAVVLGRLERVL